MKNGEWKIIPHSYQIADTGDYDGHWELTNGTISLITKDDIGEDGDVEDLVQKMNDLDVKWEDYKLDDSRWEAMMWKSKVDMLERFIESKGITGEEYQEWELKQGEGL